MRLPFFAPNFLPQLCLRKGGNYLRVPSMENLSAMWENFLLSEFEGSKYQVHDSGFEGKHLLATRFFTGRVLSMEAIAWIFKLL